MSAPVRIPIPPSVANQWHYELNAGYLPENFHSGSSQPFHWICELNHVWEARIADRCKKTSGCPYCSGNKVLIGFNDLSTTQPWLAQQWHPTKNGNLKPENFSDGSGERIIWVCPLSHDWPAPISKRKFRPNCPFCSNQRTLVGFNDLGTTHPELSKEWHPTKNTLKPTDIRAGSNKSIYWLCSQGHEWPAQPLMRTDKEQPTGCPKCSTAHTSKPEKAFRETFRNLNTFTKVNIDHTERTFLAGSTTAIQIDITALFKGHNVAIEYDGAYYHHSDKSFTRDIAKTKLMLDAGYLVVRIREADLKLLGINHKHLLQLNHKGYSNPATVERTTKEILKWLETVTT